MAASVIKGDAQYFRVVNGSEKALIFLIPYKSIDLGTVRYGGELVMRTSRGTFSAQWSNCGVEFKNFLIGLEREYLMQNLNPGKFSQFCILASARAINCRIDKAFTEKEISMAEYSACLADLADLPKRLADHWGDFSQAYLSLPFLRGLDPEPMRYYRTGLTPDMKVLWEDLWGPFIKELEKVLARQ